METPEVIRFNVYARYEPARRQERFWLESLSLDKKWVSVTHSGNLLEYISLYMVANRIKEILPADYDQKRVVFEERPLEETGLLKGITLHKHGHVLSRELTAKEKKELTDILYHLLCK